MLLFKLRWLQVFPPGQNTNLLHMNFNQHKTNHNKIHSLAINWKMLHMVTKSIVIFLGHCVKEGNRTLGSWFRNFWAVILIKYHMTSLKKKFTKFGFEHWRVQSIFQMCGYLFSQTIMHIRMTSYSSTKFSKL